MGPDLVIAVNDTHHLLVSSPEMFFWRGTAFLLLFELAGCLFVARTIGGAPPATLRRSRRILYAVPLAGLLILLFALGWTNTLDLNWDTGTATVTNRCIVGFQNSRTLSTQDMQYALLDLDRGGPRIGILLKSGEQLPPLGTISMDKPAQRGVVEAINRGLRDRDASETGPQTPTPEPTSEQLFPDYYRQLQEQKAFEQKLKQHRTAKPLP